MAFDIRTVFDPNVPDIPLHWIYEARKHGNKWILLTSDDMAIDYFGKGWDIKVTTRTMGVFKLKKKVTHNPYYALPPWMKEPIGLGYIPDNI